MPRRIRRPPELQVISNCFWVEEPRNLTERRARYRETFSREYNDTNIRAELRQLYNEATEAQRNEVQVPVQLFLAVLLQKGFARGSGPLSYPEWYHCNAARAHRYYLDRKRELRHLRREGRSQSDIEDLAANDAAARWPDFRPDYIRTYRPPRQRRRPE